MKSRILITKEAPTAKGMVVECAINFATATDLELKAAAGDDIPEGYVAGWASTRDLDSYGHVVEAGAFSAAIAKRGISGPKGIKFLKGHDRDWPIGVIKVLEYRGDRLWIEAQFDLEISYAKDLWRAVKMNGGMSFSVGFFLEDYDWKVTSDPEVEYLYITKGDLFEVSVVPFAGNEEAVMTYVKDAVKDAEKGGAITTPSQFEKALVAAGLCKNRNDAHAAVLLMKKHATLFIKDGETLEDPPPSDDPPAPVLDPAQMTAVYNHLQTIKAILTTHS